MSTEATAKSILVGLFTYARMSTPLKSAVIDEFIANTGLENASFQMSYNSLLTAISNNDANNSELQNIIMNANGCHTCIKLNMFP